MHIVQPIRSLEKIQEVKQYLMKKSDRDYFFIYFRHEQRTADFRCSAASREGCQEQRPRVGNRKQNEKEKKNSDTGVFKGRHIRLYKRHERG